MRILQLVSSTGFYGAERMVLLLASSLANAGAEVCIGIFNATTPACAMFVQAAGKADIAVWDLPCKGRGDLKSVRNLQRFLQINQFDVVHSHGYKANAYALIAARMTGCAVLATCHNWTRRTAALQRYAALDRFLLRRFDMVAAVSQGIATELRSAGVRRVRTVPNGIDLSRFSLTSSYRGHRPLILGCLSRLSKEKGLDVLLWSLPKVLAKHPYVQCVVAGEGPEKERLRALAEELGVSSSFHMPGFCDDTPEFLKRCTVVVQPSRIEAMPLAVLEAMAAGKAIVASAVGEIPRLLEDGNAGVLVPPENPDALAAAISGLLSNPDRLCALEKRAAAKAAEQFDASTMAQRYLQMYRLASQRSPVQRRARHPNHNGVNI